MRLLKFAGIARRAPLLALPALILLAAVGPALAGAATFCVHSPPECSGTNSANLQSALNSAAANGGGRDEIKLGVGLFNDGPAVDVAGNPVDIVGVAANQTAIRSSSTMSGLVLLDIQEPTSTVRDLRIHHNSAATLATGLVLAGEAEGVLVTNQLGGQFDGVRLIDDDALLLDSGVVLQYPEEPQNRAVFVTAGNSPAIIGSYLEGTVGVIDSGGATTILRTRIRATQGVAASAGADTVVRDTEIRVPGPVPANFTIAALTATGSGTTSLEVERVTARGGGAGTIGAWVVPNGGAGNNSTISLSGSVLADLNTDALLMESGGANATLTTERSAYDFGGLSIGAGTTYTPGVGNLDLDPLAPGFVDADSGDLSLLHDSPLVDLGDPGFSPFIALDVLNRPRVRDGDGDGDSVVDIGAHEYQRAPPVAAASAPAGGQVGQPLTFDGSDSSDADGEALTYAWSFDDGTAATGPVVQKAFSTPGPHTGTLTVTDAAGVSDDAVATVVVEQAATVAAAPVLTGLRLVPKRFRAVGAKPAARASATRAGTRIKFTLSAAARVTFTIHRARPRRAAGRRWVRVGSFGRNASAGANSHRWGGNIGKRALPPGGYRLTARPRDASGSPTPPQRKRFTILSG